MKNVFRKAELITKIEKISEDLEAVKIDWDHPSLVLFNRFYANPKLPSVLIFPTIEAARAFYDEARTKNHSYTDAAIDLFHDGYSWSQIWDIVQESRFFLGRESELEIDKLTENECKKFSTLDDNAVKE